VKCELELRSSSNAGYRHYCDGTVDDEHLSDVDSGISSRRDICVCCALNGSTSPTCRQHHRSHHSIKVVSRRVLLS